MRKSKTQRKSASSKKPVRKPTARRKPKPKPKPKPKTKTKTKSKSVARKPASTARKTKTKTRSVAPKPKRKSSVRDPAYYSSAQWRAVRERKLESKQYRCEKCGARKSARVQLHCHHRNYERWGHEWLRDLRVLCQSCHLTMHGNARRTSQRKTQRRTS